MDSGLWAEVPSRRGLLGKTCLDKEPHLRSSICGLPRSLQEYMRQNSISSDSRPSMMAGRLTNWVNSDLGLDAENRYAPQKVQITLYIDGHRRTDVIADNYWLHEELEEVCPHLLSASDVNQVLEGYPYAWYVLFSQNETMHLSNDVST